MTDFDLLWRGGTVIDGTGTPGFKADVAIRGDRVAALLPPGEGAAGEEWDVSGLVVSPGLIDVHNHSDGWLTNTPHLVSKTMQGFTTEVLMSDGISYAPVTPSLAPHWLHYLRSLNGLQVREYTGWCSQDDYRQLLHQRTAQNSALQIPYANVRAMACGWGRAKPDDTEMRQIQAEIRHDMEQGAVGLSTGLDYIVQCFSDTDELVEACRAMAPWQGLYVTHIRYKKGIIPALQEAVDICRRAEVPLHVSHLKGDSTEQMEEVLDFIDRVAVPQVDFTFDVYPYLPGSTMLNSLLPYEAWEDGPLAVQGKLHQPEMRRKFQRLLEDYRTDLDHIRIAWVGSRANQRLQGMSLAAYIAETGDTSADALADLLIDENLAVLCVFHRGDDRLVYPFLQHAKFILGSDGIYFPQAQTHPRQFGSAPRILGPLVRDEKLFTLETALQKMTSLPAARFGLKDRGLLRAGAFADLVAFDPLTIGDRATFEQPQQLSTGMVHVLVNGTPIIRQGVPVEPLAELPGRALKFKV